MLTENMTGLDVIEECRKARELRGPGVNEGIPMTRRPLTGRSRAQIRRDGEIAKELIYIADVLEDQRALLGAFLENKNRLSPQVYWLFLKIVWLKAGTMENVSIFRELLMAKKPWKNHLMSPEEEAALKAMPDEFTVWRAPRPGGDNGISWSVLRAFVAEYAAKNGREVIERQVKKSEVLAYFDRVGEGEIIVL